MRDIQIKVKPMPPPEGVDMEELIKRNDRRSTQIIATWIARHEMKKQAQEKEKAQAG